MGVNFGDIGFIFPEGHLTNLISNQDYGYVKGFFSTSVESHSVVVLRLDNPK